jgi:high-affinity Fe2+/Pb2+ permease
MRLLESLAGIFIDTFGITQPTDKTRRQAAWFILGMLTLVLCGLVAGGFIIFHFVRS